MPGATESSGTGPRDEGRALAQDRALAQERRALERKAYSRDGRLTAPEARRLHELQERARAAGAQAGSAGDAASTAQRGESSRGAAGTSIAEFGSAEAASGEGAPAWSAISEDPSPVAQHVLPTAGADRTPGASTRAVAEAQGTPPGGPGDVRSTGAAAPGGGTTSTPATPGAPGAAASSRGASRAHVRAGVRPMLHDLRRHIATTLTASALLLALGVGTGWLLFAPRDSGPSLTAEQQQRRAQLEAEEDYDQGSVRAVAESEGALAWFATQDQAKKLCLILDVEEQSQAICQAAEDAGLGLGVMVPLPSAAGTDDEGMSLQEHVAGTLLMSAEGEPMVSIQRWSMSSSLVSQFDGPQRDRAEQLVDEGFDLGLSLAGFFREEPVWIGDRTSESGVTEKCLIVDADDSQACDPIGDALERGLGVQVTDVDQASGDVLAVSVVQVAFTRQQVPYLTVTAGAVIAAASSADTSGESYLVTTGPPGDPIRVDIPGLDPDG